MYVAAFQSRPEDGPAEPSQLVDETDLGAGPGAQPGGPVGSGEEQLLQRCNRSVRARPRVLVGALELVHTTPEDPGYLRSDPCSQCLAGGDGTRLDGKGDGRWP